MEFHLWCDESVSRGDHFSNFYGGALVSSAHLSEVVDTIESQKQALHFFGEVKWTKVSENYLEKYKTLASAFFALIAQRKVRVRIMCRQNCHQPVGLTNAQQENEYFLLYYQFIKHAFGFSDAPLFRDRVSLRINFDKLPDKHTKRQRFKQYIYGLNNYINYKNIFLERDNIAEVSSHDHAVLQCVDLVLGAMSFKLNKQDRVKPPGSRRRGRKTIAKDHLYRHINQEIRNLYPGYAFNIGLNTRMMEGKRSRWSMPYRHWLFKPRERQYVPQGR